MVADPVLSSKYWLVRKVVAVIGYFGGFRNVELKSLKFGFVMDSANKPTAQKVWEKSDDGSYWFNFYRSKQRASQVLTQICVPKCSKEMVNCTDSVDRVPIGVCPASVIDQYLSVLSSDLNCSIEQLEGDFFKSTHGKIANKFVRVPLGKNKLAQVGIEFAQELMLPNPSAYTGHCWRRSCSTNSSDAGVNVTSLMAHMGWADPKTAIRYVQKSKQSAFQMAMYLINAQRSNMNEADLFRLPKVAPDLKSSFLPSRVHVPDASSSVSINQTVVPEPLRFVSPAAASLVSINATVAPEPLRVNSPAVATMVVSKQTAAPNPFRVEPSSALSPSISVREKKVSPDFLSAQKDHVESVLPAVEGVPVVPVGNLDNHTTMSCLETRLSGLVGSIANSGTIHFNVQFVTK